MAVEQSDDVEILRWPIDHAQEKERSTADRDDLEAQLPARQDFSERRERFVEGIGAKSM